MHTENHPQHVLLFCFANEWNRYIYVVVPKLGSKNKSYLYQRFQRTLLKDPIPQSIDGDNPPPPQKPHVEDSSFNSNPVSQS